MDCFRKAKKYTCIALLAAFILLIQNNMMNMHTHFSPQGMNIQHAHPFPKAKDNSPIKKHSHTAAQFAYWSEINSIFSFVPFICLAFAIVLSGRSLRFTFGPINSQPAGCKLTTLLRGPPRWV